MTFVELQNIQKTFPSPGGKAAGVVYAVRDVSLAIERGEMVALLGASGSGKTTLLRCLAGLEQPDSGDIVIDGTTVFSGQKRINLSPVDRDLGMIFQSYALWPHMTVAENVGYPLARRRLSTPERKKKVEQILELVGCGPLTDRYPHQLSGGQQQRIALARALVYEPRLVLFDEPLSNLDAGLREQLRYYIREIKRTLGFTGVYVTHDQGEAFFVGDKVAVLSGGALLQYASPKEVYTSPASPEVAHFLGANNQVQGTLVGENGKCYLVSDDIGRLDISQVAHCHAAPGDKAILMFRADEVTLQPHDTAGMPATISDRVDLGSHVEYLVDSDRGNRWRCHIHRGNHFYETGERITVVPKPDMAVVFRDEASR